MNYILWLEDILQAARLAEPLDTPPEAVTGIDVGTGASAIYPLLGCRSNPSWNFVATDVDEKSLHHARLNVQQNWLQERISVIASDPAGPILLHLFNLENRIRDPRPGAKYDFTMCNPPFYSSREDVLRSAEVKEFEPTAVCTGADVEMVTPGGEANFVCTMVRESLETRAQCRWYTSMLGKLASLTDVVALLRAETVDNYACTEFVQGQTRRWAIAWSFGDVRLPDHISRISNAIVQSLMPPRNTLQQVFPGASSMTHLATALALVLSAIEGLSVRPVTPALQPATAEPPADVLVSAARDTWTRAARRKKVQAGTMDTDENSDAPALICRVTCIDPQDGGSIRGKAPEGLVVRVEWVRGVKRTLFETFARHVERKIATALVVAVNTST